jgi:hypothetical protein
VMSGMGISVVFLGDQIHWLTSSAFGTRARDQRLSPSPNFPRAPPHLPTHGRISRPGGSFLSSLLDSESFPAVPAHSCG